MAMEEDLAATLDIDELRQAYQAARSLIADVLLQVSQTGVQVVYVNENHARKAGVPVPNNAVKDELPAASAGDEPGETVARSDEPGSSGGLSKKQITKLQTLAMELSYIMQSESISEMNLSQVLLQYKKHFGLDMDTLGYSKLLPLIRAICSVSPLIRASQRGLTHFIITSSNPDSDQRQSKRPRKDVVYCLHFNKKSGCRHSNSSKLCPFEHACDSCADPSHGRSSCPKAAAGQASFQ